MSKRIIYVALFEQELKEIVDALKPLEFNKDILEHLETILVRKED